MRNYQQTVCIVVFLATELATGGASAEKVHLEACPLVVSSDAPVEAPKINCLPIDKSKACIIMKDAKGKSYEVSDARPQPTGKLVIVLDGDTEPSSHCKTSSCKLGAQKLFNIKYTLRKMECP
jgi:hypothetical protein